MTTEPTFGTPVILVDQPAKVGWSNRELYLEVHSTQEDAEALEAEGATAIDRGH